MATNEGITIAKKATEQLDAEHGKGYAHEHPDLLSAYVIGLEIEELNKNLSSLAEEIEGIKSKCEEVSNTASQISYNIEQKASR